ncbi:hypothetical protein HanHA300_Chr06g0205221 [Helianthus annuus]|nr:hypothetical protein HanHA300_Chr06g0205221 [Helianthus annuus]KAJ0572857.1 hypothetical protein HanHA89_Chr06g0220341 [Helianthus annuus]KAJ0737288.1 hypothetical protein HanLR1_Chr06g0205301 [Helianthus annuus]
MLFVKQSNVLMVINSWQLDYSKMPRSRKGSSGGGADLEYVHADARASAYSSFAAGAALIAGIYGQLGLICSLYFL